MEDWKLKLAVDGTVRCREGLMDGVCIVGVDWKGFEDRWEFISCDCVVLVQ